jgi:tetratricopeptide (TPR) repeat protein
VGKSARRKRESPPGPAPTATAPPAAAASRDRAWLPILLLLALVAIAYAPVRQAEFVNYDDYHYVVENAHVSTGTTPANVWWAFTAFAAGNWHPLTWLSHQLDCQFFGLRPAGHHVVNVLLHGLNAAVLLLVLRALTGSLWRSAVVAALFAVHPLNVESVAWVSERKNVLSTLLWLLTMGAYAGYARLPSRRRYAVVASLLALGLMSKPMVVTLPCVLLLLDYWPLGRFRPDAPDARASALALVREKLPLFALAAAGSMLTMAAQRAAGAVTSLDQVPLTWRLGNAVASYAAYLWKAAWPVGLAVFYPHPGSRLPVERLVVAAATLALLSLLVAWAGRPGRKPYLAVGWLWYLGTLVPVIGIVQVGSQAMADRYAYVPLLGVFVALVWGLADLVPAPRVWGALALAATAALTAATHRQAGLWHDSMALFEHARDVTRNNYVAYTNLGLAYNKQKRWEEAIRHFDRALKIQPHSAEAYGHRGLALARMGRLDDAIASLEKALEIYPKSEHAHNNLGIAYRKRDPEKALGHLRQAVALAPEFAEAWINLGAVLLERKQPEDARKAFDTALRLEPGSAVTLFRLGSVRLEHGDLDQAVAEFDAALRIDPTHADAHNSLGVARLRQGNPAGALVEFETALRLEPQHADAHSNLALALMRTGKLPQATAEFEQALRLNPRHADAHASLGALLAQSGRLDEAVPHFRAAVEADPENVVARNNLGAALLQQGDPAGAIEQLSAAIQANPANADAQSNLGVALLQQGRVPEAAEHLRLAVRAAPEHKNAREQLARAEAALAQRPRTPAR